MPEGAAIALEEKAGAEQLRPPISVLAELTHRCPLQCPYCSNPLDLSRASTELFTAEWMRVMDQAAAMGVLQIHFSGGEPTVRRDLENLTRHGGTVGLYTNLISSGVLLNRARSSAWSRPGSTMCSSASRTPSRRTPTSSATSRTATPGSWRSGA